MPASTPGSELHLSDVTCLGCGCACDDIEVRVRDNRILEAVRACDRGAAWFGDGEVPSRVVVSARDVPFDDGLAAAARVLAGARAPLVYLAPDLTTDAQREGIALADALHASLDTITSSTALPWILAGQERGRATATLGEVRHRADVVVCWAVDPPSSHPRYWTRYAPMPEGMHVGGRASRRVIAIDVGDETGPSEVDRRFLIPPGDEVATLTALTALVSGASVADGIDADPGAVAIWARARVLAAELTAGRYVLLIAAAERGGDAGEALSRAAALTSLVQALNQPTRGALSLLRDGGNRSGADAMLTAQTGYPVAVDFSRGYPRYRPHDGTAAALMARNEVDAVVVIGSADAIPAELRASMARLPGVVIGPRATAAMPAPHHVALDTGVAGIHEGGVALRLDDVPLPLRPVVSGPRVTSAVVSALRALVVTTAQDT